MVRKIHFCLCSFSWQIHFRIFPAKNQLNVGLAVIIQSMTGLLFIEEKSISSSKIHYSVFPGDINSIWSEMSSYIELHITLYWRKVHFNNSICSLFACIPTLAQPSTFNENLSELCRWYESQRFLWDIRHVTKAEYDPAAFNFSVFFCSSLDGTVRDYLWKRIFPVEALAEAWRWILEEKVGSIKLASSEELLCLHSYIENRLHRN